MPDKELVNVIKWRDDPASQKVLERLEKLQDRAARLQQRLDGLQTVTRMLQQQWGDLDSASGGASNALEDQASSAQRAERALKELKAVVRDTDKALDDLEEPRTVTVKTDQSQLEQARRYGDVESRTRAITGAVGYLGGTEFEHIANVGAEMLAVNEAAGLLRKELPDLVAGMGLTATNAGLLAGGITAAAAGVYLLYDAITDANKKAREEAKKNAELLKSEAEGYATGVGLTTKELDDAVEAQQRRVEVLAAERDHFSRILDVQKTYNDLLDQQADIEQDIATAAQLGRMDDIPELERQLDNVNEQIAALAETAGVSELSSQLFKQAATYISDYNDEIESLNRGTEGLTSAYESAIVAANDAAAAEEELFNTRRTVADKLLADTEKAVQEQADRQAELESIMPDDVDNILRGLATDLEAVHAQQNRLNKLYRDGGVDQDYYQEQMQALNATERDLVETTEHYQTVAAEAARINQREADALERVNELTKARHDLIKQETAAQEKAAQELARAAELAANYTDQVAQTGAKRLLQEQRDEQDFQRQRARDIANHYADLASVDAKYYESVADTLSDLADDVNAIDQEKVKELADQNKDMQRLAKDHNKAMLQIARDLDTGQQDAVEERDVSAAIRNARQAQEDARNQNEQYEEERDRREEDFEDRLKELDEQRAEKQERGRQALQDLKTQHQKERQQNIAAFNAEIALENQERRIKLQRQQEDYRNEDQLRRQNFTNQISQYSQHYRDVLTTTQTGLGNVQTAVQAAWNAIAGSITSSGLTVSGGGSARYVSGDGRAKKYGTGGKLLPDQWVILGDTGAEAARFRNDGSWEALNPRKTQQVMSQQGLSISVPVQIYDASSPAMIESVFEQRVIPKLITAVRQAAPQGAR